MKSQDLMKTGGIDAALAAYERKTALLEEAATMFDEWAEASMGLILKVETPWGNTYKIGDGYGLERLRYALVRSAWKDLVSDAGVLPLMDRKRRTEFENAVYETRRQDSERSLPEFTRENIEGALQGYANQAVDMYEQGILDAARSLCWNYKTNAPDGGFSPKMILSHQSEAWDRRWGGEPKVNRDASLIDLHRALCTVAKVLLPCNETTVSGMAANDWTAAPITQSGTPALLEFKLFKNGNAHVRILNPKHVRELNRVLAKHYPNALPRKRD